MFKFLNLFPPKPINIVNLTSEELSFLGNEVARNLKPPLLEWNQLLSAIKCLPHLFALAGIKEDSLIRYAIRSYINACDDVERVEQANANQSKAASTDTLMRFRRVRNEKRYLLQQLGVEIHTTKEGKRLKEKLFKVEGSVPTNDPSLHTLVSESFSPAFTWQIDSQDCLEPGKVATYLLTDEAVEDMAEEALAVDEAFAEEVSS